MAKVRKYSPIKDAWQYASSDPIPSWAARSLRETANGLVLDRTTGAQVVNPGDWLIRDPDSRDHLHLTDKDFRDEYEVVF